TVKLFVVVLAVMAPLAAPPEFVTVKATGVDMVSLSTLPKSALGGSMSSTAAVSVKLAKTICAWDMGTVQSAVPAQPAPDQPLNTDSPPATACKVTVAVEKVAEQVSLQSMPAGSEVTVPEPPPITATVRSAVPVPSSAALGTPPGSAEAVSSALF